MEPSTSSARGEIPRQANPARTGDAPSEHPEVTARIGAALALVPAIVRQMTALLFVRVARKDDLVSYANEGALTAGRSYDATYGVPFNRWAALKIRGAIIDGLRGDSILSRRMHARLRAIGAALLTHEGAVWTEGEPAPASGEAADVCITDRLAAMATAYAAGTLLARDEQTLQSLEDPRGTPEEELARRQLKNAVCAAIAERPEAERSLLERYYFEGATMAEASGGRSRSWASRLHARAIGGVAKSLMMPTVPSIVWRFPP
jgi:RNA polymerase sigma factor FliA